MKRLDEIVLIILLFVGFAVVAWSIPIILYNIKYIAY